MYLLLSKEPCNILLAYCLFLLTYLRHSPVLSFRQPQVLYIAQCKAMCMEACQRHFFNSSHANAEWLTKLRHSPHTIRDFCNRATTFPYQNCEESCERTADVYKRSPLNCATFCQNLAKGGESSRLTGCISGCEFYQKAIVTQPGPCPIQSRRSDSQQSADSNNQLMRFQNPCIHDEECRNEGYLCCTLECVKPDYFPDVPPAISGIRIMEQQRESYAFEMTWSLEESSPSAQEKSTSEMTFPQPPIYIIQVRTYFGPDFQTHLASDWKTLVYTTHRAATMGDLSVGMWYQFRLASVSTQGSRGFEGSLSPPVLLSVTPRVPSPPMNVSSQLWRLLPHRKANVHVVWKAPFHHNIPITNYEISWRQDHGILQSDGRPINSLVYTKDVIPGTKQNYWIENLVVGVRYKVEVRAISLWGDKQYQSPTNTIFLTAPYENPSSKLDPKKIISPTEQCDCRLVNSKTEAQKFQTDFVTVERIFYSTGGQLQAQIKIVNRQTNSHEYVLQWSPRVCIETSDSDDSRASRNSKGDSVFVMPSTMSGGRMELSSSGRIHGTNSSAQDILLLSSLHFNCRYELLLCPKKSFNSFDLFTKRERCIKQCFCTPSCQTVALEDVNVPPSKCSQRNNLSLLRAPLQLSYNILNYNKDGESNTFSSDFNTDMDKVDVRIHWKHAIENGEMPSRRSGNRETTNSGIRTRIQWGPALQEPVDARLYATHSSTGSSSLIVEASSMEEKNASKSPTSLSVPLRSTRLVVSSLDDTDQKSPSLSSDNTQREQVVYFTPQWDLQKLEVKVIPENITSLTLHNLSPNRLYIVSVQGLLVSHNEQQYVGPKSHLYIHLTSPSEPNKAAQYSSQGSNQVDRLNTNQLFILVIFTTVHLMWRIHI